MTTLERLKRGLKRIRKGWCKFRLAEDKYDFGTCPTSPSAVKHCALGALLFSADKHQMTWNLAIEAEGHLIRTLKLDGVSTSCVAPLVEWNNHVAKDQAEVISLYRRTIARLERAKKAKVRK